MKKIILASASPRRREILHNMGLEFTVMPAADEEKTEKVQPSEVVEELSLSKALNISKQVEKDTLIIGADTVVAFDGKILGKPKNQKDAFETLKLLQGTTHQVYTGVTILCGDSGEWVPVTFSECTQVTFYPVSEEEILRYVESGEGMDKAGSYGIQGYFGGYVKKIDGDYLNVVGFPAARMFYELKKRGIDLRG